MDVFTGFTTGDIEVKKSKNCRRCPFTFNAKEVYGVTCLKDECMAWDEDRNACAIFELHMMGKYGNKTTNNRVPPVQEREDEREEND